MTKKRKPPNASDLLLGRCDMGICIDMLDERGRVICHAHGFDAVEVYRKLGELIAATAPHPGNA